MDLYHHSDPPFTKWVVAEGLLAEPFVVIDIGVQGGEHPRWQFLGRYAEIYGFDPIAEVVDELRRSAGGSPSRRYYNMALGNEDGERDFFIPTDRFGSSFYQADPKAEKRIVPIRRLDTLYREGTIPRPDYIKLDCEGFEPEILRGAREYFTECEVLCVTAETNFHVSPILPHTHFHAVNEIMAEHRLLVYDINDVRSPTPAYLAALAARPAAESSQNEVSMLAPGRPGTCDVLFCRDFATELRDPGAFWQGTVPRPPSTEMIIKAMINFELHGLMDCAIELAATFRDLLAPRLDVERAIALLLAPAPHPRNTADVVLAQTRQVVERAALTARVAELEAALMVARNGAVAAGVHQAARKSRTLRQLNAWRLRLFNRSAASR